MEAAPTLYFHTAPYSQLRGLGEDTLLSEVSVRGLWFPSHETWPTGDNLVLCLQGGYERRTDKEAIHCSSRLKLQFKECSRQRWSAEERWLQSQPEKKLGQTKNRIFF